MLKATARALIVAIVGSVSSVASAQSQGAQGWPTVAEVAAKAQGATPVETAALQTAVFRKLSSWVRAVSAGGEFGNDMTPAERERARAYTRASTDAERRGRALLTGERNPNPRWLELDSQAESKAHGIVRGSWPKLAGMFAERKGADERDYQTAIAAQPQAANPSFLDDLNRRFSPAEKRTLVATIVYTFVVIGLFGFMAMIAPRYARDGFTSSLALPDAVRDVRLLLMRYSLTLGSGRIYDRIAWNEVQTTTHTTSGRVEQLGNQIYVTPSNTSTTTSSTLHERLSMRGLDGTHFTWQLDSNSVATTPGHVLSMAYVGEEAVLVYNHMTDQLLTFNRALQTAHSRSRFGCLSYLGLTAISGAVMYLAGSGLGPSLMFATFVLFVGGFVNMIANIVARSLRIGRFRRVYVPQLRKFLRDSSEGLVARLEQPAGSAQSS